MPNEPHTLSIYVCNTNQRNFYLSVIAKNKSLIGFWFHNFKCIDNRDGHYRKKKLAIDLIFSKNIDQ